MVEDSGMSIILFSGEMDKALAAFTLAVGGASIGMKVTVFFTFWGLNTVKRNRGAIKSSGIKRGLLNMLNRGGNERLPLSRFQMLGIGKWIMKKVMKESRMPQVDELMKTAKELGVKFLICTQSMGIMGLSREAFIDGIDDYVGVASYVVTAKDNKINLFI